MINGQLKSKIDKLWEEFWTGGITNPLTVIEQITFLIYARLLDMNETSDEKKPYALKKNLNGVLTSSNNIFVGIILNTLNLPMC